MTSGITVPSLSDLCSSVEKLVPVAVGRETWYLIIATVLTASPNPASLADLYTHLTSTPDFSTEAAKSHLSLRLRDVLLKLTTVVGAPPVIVAVSALAKAEGEPQLKAAGSELSEKWRHLDMHQITKRGEGTINSIYGPLLPKIFSGFGTHSKDIQHMELAVVYGLYLSDHSVLNAVEAEVVVLTAILCSGLRSPSLWHLRGLNRLLGARGADASEEVKKVVMAVREAAATVVRFCGQFMEQKVNLQAWPKIDDIAGELGGFGDDE